MDQHPNIVYGRLLESAHITGYSFARSVDEFKWLLQEDRWRECGDGFTDPQEFTRSVNFGDVRLLIEQRKEIVKLLDGIGANQVEISKALGVGLGTVNRDLNDSFPSGKSKTEKPNVIKEADSDNFPVGKNDQTEQKPAVAAPAFATFDPAKGMKKQETREKAGERREQKLEEIAAGNTDLDTSTRFPIIYADPPWRYENPPIGASGRSIENHYPTMTLEEICAMPVADLATEDAMLYLWATAPKLAECMQVITAWGFEYRTNMVWDKVNIGMGYHARNQHELLLIARRGDIPPPFPGSQPSSIYTEKRGDHSVKPEFFAAMIEGFYPGLPKIELFRRGEPRKGWAAFGNQAGGQINAVSA